MADSGVAKIVTLFKELESRDSARNASYDEVLKFYGGKTYKDTKKQGFVSGISQALSSIFSPKTVDEDLELRTPINLVKPAIENKVAFLALQPTIRVIEPPDQLAPGQMNPASAAPALINQGQEPTSEGGWGITIADGLEKVLTSLLAFSNLPQRCRDIAWSMCAMDGAVIGVWPDLKHEKPRLFTRTPQDFYPVSYDPDGLELTQAVWMEQLSGSDVYGRWGLEQYKDQKEVEVIQYIDGEQFCTILDQREWAHPPIENKLGLVPIVCVGNLGLPGMIFGSTDIKDAIAVAKQINYHMALVDEMSAAMVNPTIVVKDALNAPENFAIGQGGIITMGPQGSVDVIGPIQLPNGWWQLSGLLQNWFDIIADNPAILRSDEGGGLTTGKGFNAKLGPIAARMQTRLEILMSAYRQVFKYMLLMWANFPGTQAKIKATGIKGKESFYIEAAPEDFKVDGEIWTEMEVFLDAQSYIDRQTDEVMLMQLYQNELVSKDTVMDHLRYVTNKKREVAKIDADRQWKAQGLAIANSMANAPMTANPNLADQQMTNYGLERGLVGETGPPGQLEGMMPGLPGGSPGVMPGVPTEGEEDIVAILQEFFESIPKLKGAAWWGGSPLTNPAAMESDNWTVSVWITNPADKGTITRAAEKVPEIYGHIRFITGRPSPDQDAIQFSGGPMPTPQEAPTMAQPEAGPEAMLGLPGGE